MNTAFAFAAFLTFATTLLHLFGGGPATVGPLLEAKMDPVAKYTNYYCWHIVSMTLLIMGMGYAYAAMIPGGADVAALVTAISAACAVWSVVLVAWHFRHPLLMPQWLLFSVITLVALVGFVP